MRKILLTATAALLTALAAPAQAQPQADLTGQWVFEAPLDGEPTCLITGTATVAATSHPDVFNIRTVGNEVCEVIGTWTTEQSCIGRRKNAEFSVRCELITAEPDNYAADHFVLQIRSATQMSGTLVSLRRGAATWRRPPPALVS